MCRKIHTYWRSCTEGVVMWSYVLRGLLRETEKSQKTEIHLLPAMQERDNVKRTQHYSAKKLQLSRFDWRGLWSPKERRLFRPRGLCSWHVLPRRLTSYLLKLCNIRTAQDSLLFEIVRILWPQENKHKIPNWQRWMLNTRLWKTSGTSRSKKGRTWRKNKRNSRKCDIYAYIYSTRS